MYTYTITEKNTFKTKCTEIYSQITISLYKKSIKTSEFLWILTDFLDWFTG